MPDSDSDSSGCSISGFAAVFSRVNDRGDVGATRGDAHLEALIRCSLGGATSSTVGHVVDLMNQIYMGVYMWRIWYIHSGCWT